MRTWLQHAWADTLHDRLYKNKLGLSPELKRTGNLLAALMEAADRSMNELADELDGMIANYTAFATKADVARETALQNLIYDNEPSSAQKPALAIGLACLAKASGDYLRVVELLQPYSDVESPQQCELLLDLGDSLCRHYRDSHASPEYERGLDFLKASLALCENGDVSYVPLLRRRDSLHGRVLGHIAWALEVVEGEAHQAMEKYRHGTKCNLKTPTTSHKCSATTGSLPTAATCPAPCGDHPPGHYEVPGTRHRWHGVAIRFFHGRPLVPAG